MIEREGSAVRALLRSLAAQFAHGWRTLDLTARKRWMLTLAAGFLAAAAALSVMVTTGSRIAGNGPLAWEPAFLLALAERGPLGFSDAVWFQTFGTDITLVILILLIGGGLIRKERPISALSLALAALGMDWLVRIGWASWDRARPDLIAEGIGAPGFHSFPSGHAAKTVAVYGFLAALWWRASRSTAEKLLILLLAAGVMAVVPIGRMRMGAHWPTDILGGYVIGFLWLTTLIVGLRQERTDRQPA